jgi:hypothetical protein
VFGKKEVLTSKTGESLLLRCEDADVPFFALYFVQPNGVKNRIGTCPFEGGCNQARFSYILKGRVGLSDMPDRILRTFWRSKDYGDNDDKTLNSWTKTTNPGESLLDWAESDFNAEARSLEKLSIKWEYRFGPPVFGCPARPRPEGKRVSSKNVDPPLGPETEAFFREIEDGLQVLSPIQPMDEDTSSPCDLNRDGVCNELDFHSFAKHMGSCRSDPLYDPLADIDGNGCVDSLDQYVLYDQDSDRDGVPDIRDNCLVSSNSPQTDADRDGIGDSCDNCPYAANYDQKDTDEDGTGDACE